MCNGVGWWMPHHTSKSMICYSHFSVYEIQEKYTLYRRPPLLGRKLGNKKKDFQNAILKKWGKRKHRRKSCEIETFK